MKFYQKYVGYSPEIDCEPFPANVPGNIQLDYITAHPEFVNDINYGMEHKKMVELEPYTWYYLTNLEFERTHGEKLWFVTEGIDYAWSVYLNGEKIFAHEGMFSKVEICLDDVSEELFGRKTKNGDELKIHIAPHPMLDGKPMDRQQAAQCCKPPVSYGWDWHPRVIPSGIWDETYLETRGKGFIRDVKTTYTLDEKLKTAYLRFKVDSELPALVRVFDPDGEEIAKGTTKNGEFETPIEDVKLWWCRGYGEPNLYKYTVTSTEHARQENTVEREIGFRKIELTMNGGRHFDPIGFPKSRANPPAQLTLNGVNVFAKGTNYVNQEIFAGTMTEEKYEELIKFAHDANMNIFRCWGGSGAQKDIFYTLCDRYGIMVWFEFPLACNDYYDSDEYLSILKQEATALVLKLRHHPSIVLWCGGNELFNSWSGMTDQRAAIRLLNKITFELAPEIPYNPTSPLDGMKHGGYTFIDATTGLDQFELFGKTRATAYTEFGIPATPPADYLRSFIPEDELFPPKPDGVWEAHHAFRAWGGVEPWLCLTTLDKYGSTNSLEDIAETSNWLQNVGYKAIFEEARRQKPMCAMAINWCWCEPWKCAANNSLIAYPNVKKGGYFGVQDSLRDVVPAAKFKRFAHTPGEEMKLGISLLNDGQKAQNGTIETVVKVGDVVIYRETTLVKTEENANSEIKFITVKLPEDLKNKERFDVELKYSSEDGTIVVNTYKMVVLA